MLEDPSEASLPTAPTGAVARRRARVSEEILTAAWEVCREVGLSGLTLRAVASRLGMQAPSLYSYFASKDAIYDAMFAAGQHELRERMSFLPEDRLTREDFRAAAHAFFAFSTEDHLRYQLLFQRTIPGFVPSPDSYRLATELVDRLRAQLASAGVDDPRHLDLWTAVLTGLTDQQISNDPDGDRWGRLLDEAVDLFCDHAGIPPAATKETP